MLKKTGLVAAAVLTGALTMSGLAYADDEFGDAPGGSSGESYGNEEQSCDEDILSGALSIPPGGDVDNESDDDVDCDQDSDDDEDEDDDHDEDDD